MRKAAEPTVAYQEHASTSPDKSSRDALSVTSDRKGKCFLVPADEIRVNKYDLSISRYKQIEHKEIEFEKPGVIMDKVMALEREIAKDVEEIKGML
jgi:type I restriction-modification system DNA methylase subunit